MYRQHQWRRGSNKPKNEMCMCVPSIFPSATERLCVSHAGVRADCTLPAAASSSPSSPPRTGALGSLGAGYSPCSDICQARTGVYAVGAALRPLNARSSVAVRRAQRRTGSHASLGLVPRLPPQRDESGDETTLALVSFPVHFNAYYTRSPAGGEQPLISFPD